MNTHWRLWALLFVATSASAAEPARLDYSSATDFTELSVVLKNADPLNAGYVPVSATLSPEARARTAAISMLAFNKPVSAYIDGHLVSTATVRSALTGGQIRFSAPRAMVAEWLPRFLQ